MKISRHLSFAVMLMFSSESVLAQADGFDKYNDRISMQCIGEQGMVQVYVQGDELTILGADSLPFSAKIDGKTGKKNGDKEQYIINTDLEEIFVDFEKKSVVYTIMGFPSNLSCY